MLRSRLSNILCDVILRPKDPFAVHSLHRSLPSLFDRETLNLNVDLRLRRKPDGLVIMFSFLPRLLCNIFTEYEDDAALPESGAVKIDKLYYLNL